MTAETGSLEHFKNSFVEAIDRPHQGLLQIVGDDKNNPQPKPSEQTWADTVGHAAGSLALNLAPIALSLVPGRLGKILPVVAGGISGALNPTEHGGLDLGTRIGNAATNALTVGALQYGVGALGSMRRAGEAANIALDTSRTNFTAGNFLLSDMRYLIPKSTVGKVLGVNAITGLANRQFDSLINQGQFASVSDSALSVGTWMAGGTAGHYLGAGLLKGLDRISPKLKVDPPAEAKRESGQPGADSAPPVKDAPTPWKYEPQPQDPHSAWMFAKYDSQQMSRPLTESAIRTAMHPADIPELARKLVALGFTGDDISQAVQKSIEKGVFTADSPLIGLWQKSMTEESDRLAALSAQGWQSPDYQTYLESAAHVRGGLNSQDVPIRTPARLIDDLRAISNIARHRGRDVNPVDYAYRGAMSIKKPEEASALVSHVYEQYPSLAKGLLSDAVSKVLYDRPYLTGLWSRALEQAEAANAQRIPATLDGLLQQADRAREATPSQVLTRYLTNHDEIQTAFHHLAGQDQQRTITDISRADSMRFMTPQQRRDDPVMAAWGAAVKTRIEALERAASASQTT